MEVKIPGYLLEKLPIPEKQHYLKAVSNKAESFITSLR